MSNASIKANIPTTASTTAIVTVGHTQYRVTGDPVFANAVRVAAQSSAEKAAELVKAQQERNNALRAKAQPVPLVARPGSRREFPGEQYSNRPSIWVRTREGADGSDSLVGIFNDWILSDVQESDAEKIDVVETFGAPHLFVSGRFIRKYTFAGVVRAVPVNASAEESGDGHQAHRTLRLRTTQFDLLRLFYDQYLRATEQAARGTYTEIHVDTQVYTGYVGTMNFQRGAETDQLVPFSFTMYGINRSGLRDGDANRLLVAGFGSAKRKGSQFTDKQAAAELSAAHGTVTLKITGDIDLGVVSPDAPNGTAKARPVVKLEATGSPVRVKVTGPRGARLLYRKVGGNEVTPVDNSPAPIGTEDITVEVTDYFLLYQELVKATPTAEEKLVSTTFTLKADSGATAIVNVRMTLKGQAKVVLSSLSGLLNNTELPGSFATGADVTKPVQLGVIDNAKAFTDQNTVPVELRVKLAYPDKTPLDITLLPKSVVTLGSVLGGPAVGAELKPSTQPSDAGKVAASQSPALVSSVVGDTLSLRFTLATQVGVADGHLNAADYSPFTFADRMMFTVKGATVTVPGLAALPLPDLVFAVTVPSQKGRAIFRTITLYSPGGIVDLPKGGKSVTFTFSFNRAIDVHDPIDESMLDAIRAMTCNLALTLPSGWTTADSTLVMPLRAPSQQHIDEIGPVTATPTVWAVGGTVNVQVVFSTPKEPDDMATFIRFAQKLADPNLVSLSSPQGSPIRAPFRYQRRST